jgi:ribulose-5-phosphate 4-epimerase/fuculose-1-phosphate aldolase
MSKQTIALVGGTGTLGTLIANAVLDKPDVQLKLLVRPGSRDKTSALEKRGAQVVEGAIGSENGSMESLCQGASTVISAVAELLGSKRAVVMRGNGAITVGASIEEAVALAWYLEDAARLEMSVLSSGLDALEFTPEEVRDRAITAGGLYERMWSWLTANDPES